MASFGSPARRVLGEKDANASISITSPTKHHGSKAYTKASLYDHRHSRLNPDDLKSPITSPRAGQKRKLIEAEGTRTQQGGEECLDEKRRSVRTDSWSSTALPSDAVDGPVSLGEGSGQTDGTSMTSLMTSQDKATSPEPQFDLMQEEMSQKTLDKIHAVQLPQNASQPTVMPQSTYQTESSMDSVRMSSFIDFGGSDSSQRSDGLGMIETVVPAEKGHTEVSDDSRPGVSADPATQILTAAEKRKIMLDEKAQQLRARLQLAYFKVQTNQTSRPMSRLRIPESMRKSPTASRVNKSSSTKTVAAPIIGQSTTNIDPNLEVQAFAQRCRTMNGSVGTIKPSISPRNDFTTRSASQIGRQTIHGHPMRSRSPDPTSHFPSSPPPMISTPPSDVEEGVRNDAEYDRQPEADKRSTTNTIPTTPSAKTMSATGQLSSPPASHDGDGDDNDRDEQPKSECRPQPRSLTSSVVKGEAADSLLQLMKGAE